MHLKPVKNVHLAIAVLIAAIAIGLTLTPSSLIAQNATTNSTTTNQTTVTNQTKPVNNATNQTTTTPTPGNATKPICTCNQSSAVVVAPGGGNVTIPPVTPSNETKLKQMLLAITPDHAVIDRGNTQRITITATTDNGTGIPNAKIAAVTLNYASGANKTLSAGTTDPSGQFVLVTKIGGNSKPGQFNVIASAKADGYIDAKAVSGFIVNPKSK